MHGKDKLWPELQKGWKNISDEGKGNKHDKKLCCCKGCNCGLTENVSKWIQTTCVCKQPIFPDLSGVLKVAHFNTDVHV